MRQPSKFGQKIIKRLQKAYITFIILFLVLPLAYYGYLFSMHDFSPRFLTIEKCIDERGCWDYKLKKCIDLYSGSTPQCQRIDD